MRKAIVRTITATTINSVNVSFKDGKPAMLTNEPLTVNGTIDEEKALKAARKAYGANATITGLVEVNDVYEISVDDFIKYAKKIDKPSAEQVQEAAAE